METRAQPTNDNPATTSLIRYKIEDKPPIWLSLGLAVQHILAAFAGIVAVPLVVGNALGLSIEQNTYIVSATIFISGLTTVIQSVGIGPVGSRLPMVMGTDFSFVGPGIAVGSALGLPGYFGATFLGSFVEMFLSRFLHRLQKIFPPLVTGIVITSIGLTMLPVAIDWIGGYSVYGEPRNLFLAAIVMITILVLNQKGKGFLSSGAILIGIVIGYIIAFFLGMIDLSPIFNADWVTFPRPLRYGMKFSLIGFLSFLPAYLVTTVETIGGSVLIMKACEMPVEGKRIASGVLGDGVGSFLAGVFSSGPNTSFSQNIGLIPLTGVASRFVITLAGIILMFIGVFPKLGALISIMPSPVLGGAGVIMFGMIAVGGMKTLQHVPFTRRNSLILATSIGLGLGVSFRPDIISHFPQQLQIIFRSGMSTATLFAICLNLLLPDDPKQEHDDSSIAA